MSTLTLSNEPVDVRELFTNSRMVAARTCQRLHHIQYELGYRPLYDADALVFGTLAHAALEAWWLAADGERAQAALEALEPLREKADPYDYVKIQAIISGYDAYWGADAKYYEVLGVEVQFQCDLRNPETGKASRNWLLAGKIDVVVRDLRDGLVKIVEHKTASGDISAGSEYRRRLKMDSQVSIYYDGARSIGYEVDGCIYDVLGKPGLRPLQVNSKRSKPETPEEFQVRIIEEIAKDPSAYYQRFPVPRLESELEEARSDIWHLAQQTRESELAGRAPRNPSACVRFNKTCPFFSVCCGEGSLDDQTQYRHEDKKHPELNEANNGTT